MGAGTEQKKLDRNALSACGDSARDAAASQAHDRELNPQELSSLCTAAKAIANEVVQAADRGSLPTGRGKHALIIDGRERERIDVLRSSRAAQLLAGKQGFRFNVKLVLNQII